ncbi:MAG TPA: helix-turn-helix domain-containing protein, partial [Vicinamibacteria bacterium]|nr:helix-turn-helix domain-containing protein [Vicinamibacteria bacterium]
EFHRTKYGRELLIDVIRASDIETFEAGGDPHVLTFYEIFLVTRGRGALTLDGRVYRVAQGGVFFTSPGQPRQWLTRGMDGWCLFFTADFLEDFFKDPLFLFTLPYFHREEGDLRLALKPAEAALLAARLKAMRKEIGRLRPDSTHALRASLYETLIQLSRAFGDRAHQAPRENATALRLRRLIEHHFHEHHRPAEYARRLRITVGHLNQLSRRHLGRPAGVVIRERLALEAKRQLLHTAATAAEVAYALGFKDPAYFARFFRRETGTSPTAYRGAEGTVIARSPAKRTATKQPRPTTTRPAGR